MKNKLLCLLTGIVLTASCAQAALVIDPSFEGDYSASTNKIPQAESQTLKIANDQDQGWRADQTMSGRTVSGGTLSVNQADWTVSNLNNGNAIGQITSGNTGLTGDYQLEVGVGTWGGTGGNEVAVLRLEMWGHTGSAPVNTINLANHSLTPNTNTWTFIGESVVTLTAASANSTVLGNTFDIDAAGSFDIIGYRVAFEYGAVDNWNYLDGDTEITSVDLVKVILSPDLVYLSGTDSLSPGISQTLSLLVRNNGAALSDAVVTLQAVDAAFSVLSTQSTPSFIGAGATVTNVFTVSADQDAPATVYPVAFALNVSGVGDFGPTNFSFSVPASVPVTVFTSMGKTGFVADSGASDSTLLTISNTAAFALQFDLSSTEPWLTRPTGMLSLAAGSSTGITITADAVQTPGHGQYTDTLSVRYLNNGSTPNPAVFPIVFDVGSRVSYVSNRVVVISGGILPSLPPEYQAEPNMRLEVTIYSVNDGAVDVSNVVNTLSADPAHFSITNLTPAVYSELKVGQTASTVYQVDVGPSAPHGANTFSVTNRLGD